MAVSGMSAIIAASLYYKIRQWQAQDRDLSRNSFHLLGVLAGLCLVNTVLHMVLVPEIRHTINYIAFVLSLSLIILSRYWFYTYLLISVAAWISTVLLYNLNNTEMWAPIYFFAALLSILVHELRLYDSLATAKRIYLLRRRNDTLQRLAQSTELAQAKLEEATHLICKVACGELNLARVSVWLFREDHQGIFCLNQYAESKLINSGITEIAKVDAPDYFSALEENRTLVADDALTDSRTKELAVNHLSPLGVGARLDAPISIRGKIVGVACHEHIGSTRHWTIEDQIFAGSIADITAFAIQAQEWADLVKRNLDSERLESLGVLAGGVAHDFNNLLTIVIGHGELLNKMLTEHTEGRKSVEAILKASSHARELASQMLGYAGKASFVTQIVDLSELVRELGNLSLQDLTSEMDIFADEITEQLAVDIDPTQIQQVLFNMLTNARDAGAKRAFLRTGSTQLTSGTDFTTNNPATPSFITSTSLPEGMYAWFEVEDDGSGMDEKTMTKIFDPFFTSKSTGTGLGLAAVLGILRAHKGAVDVVSDTGKGTRFRVYLPITDAIPERIDSSRPPISCTGNSGEILLVEDDLSVQELTAIFLEQYGFSVTKFSGYNEVRSTTLTFEKDSLLGAVVDLTLEDGDGVEVVEHLRKLVPELPVVLMSGYDAGNALSRLTNRNRVTFLHKPFTSNALYSAIERSLQTHE